MNDCMACHRGMMPSVYWQGERPKGQGKMLAEQQ